MGDVHRLLYESVDVSIGIHLGTYLSDLCRHLIVANDGDSRRISVDVEADEGVWSADEAIPNRPDCQRAVTNALKHAFPGGRSGKVLVSLRDVGEDFYELEVSDDGMGETTPIRPGSLGMRLIDTFARQLRGSLAIDHDGGTRIVVKFLHVEAELHLAE